jgi:Protein of unknown function (DUF3606)
MIMPEDKSIRGGADASRINIHKSTTRYWTSKLGCTREQLLSCVQRVGVTVTGVQRCLGM